MCRTFRGLCVHLCVGRTGEPCKTAEPIEVPLGGQTDVGPKNHILERVNIGAIWRIRLNDCVQWRCALCQITLATCFANILAFI